MGSFEQLPNFSQVPPGHLTDQKQLAFALLRVALRQQLLDEQADLAGSRAAAV